MQFFSGTETRDYLSLRLSDLKQEVANIPDTEILTCDFDEWSGYLYSKYKIEELILFEESKSQKIQEIKVKKYNTFHRCAPYEPEYFLIDGVKITYKIPYDENDELWFLRPSIRIMTRFNYEFMERPKRDKCGFISLSFEYTLKELEAQGEKIPEYVQQRFENQFSSYRKMIGYVNSDVSSHNVKLKDFAGKCLEKRKKNASTFGMISKMLEIPLFECQNMPNLKPIPLKKITRSPVARPKQKPAPNEYAISDKDYDNINNIILMSGSSMEKTARSHYRNNEEELRDILLATLNTHYKNANGETFRKIGKTDINIEFENKSAFIGECKIWHGFKLFDDTVQQLLNYSTWRDVKLSIIIFNKKNKSFTRVLNKIDDWVRNNTNSYNRREANVWHCKYYRKDMEMDIRLNILAFDLYVDESQFKDARTSI